MAAELTVATRPRRRIRALDLALRGVESVSRERGGKSEDPITAAMTETGLCDFGGDAWQQPFVAYRRSLEEEAGLSGIGRRMVRGQLVHLLRNRLMIERDLALEPGITDVPVPAPLVILGLPRSGTTLLQQLLARDRSHRSLLHWEAWQPSPSPSSVSQDAQDPRIAAVERGLKLLYWLAPEARAIHPQQARFGTECVSLLANSFASYELATMHRVPSYLQYLLGSDLTEHYREHRRQLQLLQWHCRRDRWVLKSPAHLFALDALLAVYPDARLIHVHRDPIEVLPSFCSLAASLQRLTSRRVDLAHIGRTWLPAWASGVERAATTIARLPDSQVVEVRYPDLVQAPLAVIENIYDTFGLSLDATSRDRMASHLAAHPRNRYGAHNYNLDQFGLDEAEIRERFAPWYRRRG